MVKVRAGSKVFNRNCLTRQKLKTLLNQQWKLGELNWQVAGQLNQNKGNNRVANKFTAVST